MASIKFLIQSKKSPAGIYVRIRYGKDIDIKAKTNFIVDREVWIENEEAKKKSSKANKTPKEASLKALNPKIMALESKILESLNSCEDKRIIDVQWLKDIINPPVKVERYSEKLADFIDTYIEDRGSNITESSKKKLRVVKKLVEGFEKHSKSKVHIRNVDLKFKSQFQKHLEERKYSYNTIARAITFIKTVCLYARIKKVETSSELDEISVKYKQAAIVFLNPTEIKRIENAKLKDEALQNARDWLLISCETGQRISDFLRFKKEWIRYESKIPLIDFKQVKTQKDMTIPLSPKVMSILGKRNGNFPSQMYEQKYNELIKEVCRISGLDSKIKGVIKKKIKIEIKGKVTEVLRYEAGVYEKWKLIGSHVGRRSYATNNYGKIPTALLISNTGHSTERMFLQYIGKPQTDKALDLAKYYYEKR